MYRFKHIVFLLITWISLVSFTGITDDISTAFKSGKAFKISAFFNNKVDITVLDKSDLVTKLEAERWLFDFFHEHTPHDFKVLHQGKSKTGLKYTIGTLSTNNENFRVSFYVNTTQQKEYIQQLFIDAE